VDVRALDPTSRYAAARRDPTLAVLEGFHALKHALRFGADVLDVVAAEDHQLDELTERLAPDLSERLAADPTRLSSDPAPPTVLESAPGVARLVTTVSAEAFGTLCRQPPQTRVVAIARRPRHDPAAILALPGDGPVVLLEDPRTMSNMGACVRVAAAAPRVAGVLTTGESDPWNPAALRGAAGLHFALPVARVETWPGGGIDDPATSDRPLVAIDPEGDELGTTAIPRRALIAFGTERYGLSDGLLDRAALRLRIPMRAGVSSLNLATSVAAVVFGAGTVESTPAPAVPEGDR
jgi:TrmH family RNA methyltransferase